MGIIYEANTLITLREMIALKAVDDRILMRARRRLMVTVIPIEYRGRAERDSTCVKMED